MTSYFRMVWEFPAVSQSRLEFWNSPQYSKSTVLILTILFGAFGFHHFYLRSPQTALFFIFGNLLTLGYWYFYDIIQLSGSIDTLNSHGLSTPFGPAGIAQGMFIPNDSNSNSNSNSKSTTPNPLYFLAYALLLPILPLARLIAGDHNNALLSVFNFTNPFGLFFNFISVLSEYFTLFFKPADLLFAGIFRTFPFNYLGFASTGFSPNLTGREINATPCEDGNFFQRLLKSLLGSALVLFGRFLPPELVESIQSALLIGKEVKEKVINTAVDVAQTSIKTATQVGSLATQIPTAAAGALAQASSIASSSIPLQSGGSLSPIQPSWSDFILGGAAFALLVGGFALHTGRSLSNAFSISFGKDDSPPKT